MKKKSEQKSAYCVIPLMQRTKLGRTHLQRQKSDRRWGWGGGRSQDGRGIGRGDHFLFYKFIEEQQNGEQSLQNNFWSLAADIRCPEKQPIVFEGR